MNRLRRWREVTAREFPNRPDLLELIPNERSIDLTKLTTGDGGAITTDTCNSARKTRRLLVEMCEGQGNTLYEQDCFHHLRNVWINGVAKAISKFLTEYLHDSLDNISSFLRVSPDLAHVIRAYHKEFSLTANYPKGHGELFREWIIENYPMEFLLHAERAAGSRQDLIYMGADAVYMNRPLNVEFLDKKLRMIGNENILQKNLFTILSSLEMISVLRFFSILHVAVVIPFRWLAGNTHKLAKHGWGARSMGRAVDILHTTCGKILDNPKLIHDEYYMMHLFDEIADELPEFKKFLTYKFDEKQTEFIKSSQTEAVPYKMLLKELFQPTDRDNQDCTPMLKKIANIGIRAFLVELEDENKATYKYLSISQSPFSFDHCSEKEKKL